MLNDPKDDEWCTYVNPESLIGLTFGDQKLVCTNRCQCEDAAETKNALGQRLIPVPQCMNAALSKQKALIEKQKATTKPESPKAD